MKSLKFIIFICLVVCIVMNTTGCRSAIEEKTPIVSIILFGKHANSQGFDVQLQTTIQQTYSSFGNLGIIVVDGDPSLLHDDSSMGIFGCYDAEYLENSKKLFKKNDILWKKNYLNPQVKKIINELDVCKADNPEVDTLKALCTAVDSLNSIENSMGTSVKKEIIILDTGLCTSGTMNFLAPEYLELFSYDGKLWEEEIMNDKVFELINQLDNRAEIPNLNGISVTWYGLGQVSEPQPSLSKLGIQNLQYFWGEFLSRAGALHTDKTNADEKYGIFISTSTNGSIESDQYVTPIQWNINDNSEVSIRPELLEQKINFVRNSAEYLSKEDEEALKHYTSVLQNYPNEKVLLVGTTSSYSGGTIDPIELSEQRAEKVKQTMVKLGISESCISIIGLGYNPNFCQNDSPNGQFEESIAKENRSVLILPSDSSKVQEILSNK